MKCYQRTCLQGEPFTCLQQEPAKCDESTWKLLFRGVVNHPKKKINTTQMKHLRSGQRDSFTE
jgi:hypothetical protein